MILKKFFLFALVCAFFYGCQKEEIPAQKLDDEDLDKGLQIFSCDTSTGKVYAIWEAKDSTKLEDYTMYGDLSIYELLEDLAYTQEYLGSNYLYGILDVSSHSVIGWHDANGDDQNYRKMQLASWGMLTDELVARYLR